MFGCSTKKFYEWKFKILSDRVIIFTLLGLLSFSLISCQGKATGQMSPSRSSSTAAATVQSDSKPGQQAISGMQIGEKGTSINIEAVVSAIGKSEDVKSAKSGETYYYVDIAINNIGTISYDMSISQRFHLLNASREKIYVESFIAADGRDMNGAKLAAGESVTGRALFLVPDNFTVEAFTYTFDINGFGIFTYIVK